MPELFGLQNCDSCRSARRWLAAHGQSVRFIDLREHPPDARQIARWSARLGWQSLLNRRSRTWRELAAEQREGLNESKACELMRAHPTLIKRPVLVLGQKVCVGFTPERYRGIFAV